MRLNAQAHALILTKLLVVLKRPKRNRIEADPPRPLSSDLDASDTRNLAVFRAKRRIGLDERDEVDGLHAGQQLLIRPSSSVPWPYRARALRLFGPTQAIEMCVSECH